MTQLTKAHRILKHYRIIFFIISIIFLPNITIVSQKPVYNKKYFNNFILVFYNYIFINQYNKYQVIQKQRNEINSRIEVVQFRPIIVQDFLYFMLGQPQHLNQNVIFRPLLPFSPSSRTLLNRWQNKSKSFNFEGMPDFQLNDHLNLNKKKMTATNK